MADPNVVMVKKKKDGWSKSILSLSIPPSLGPVPVEEQKLGERRNEVTSSASATFLRREGGEEEGEQANGGGRGGECPETFEVTGPTSPNSPLNTQRKTHPFSLHPPVCACVHVLQGTRLCVCYST